MDSASTRSYAQAVSLALGAWWVLNGIGAFLADANFAVGDVHGRGEVLGLFSVVVNGWHALFHLLPGLLGLAASRSAQAARLYVLGAGPLYLRRAGDSRLATRRSA